MTINPAIHHVPLTTPKDYTRAIIREVAERHGVKPADILYGPRTAKLVDARHEAIVAVHHARPHWSYPDLARVFGLDHSSVIYAFQRSGLELGRTVEAKRLRNLCHDLAAFAGALEIITDEAEASWSASGL